MISKQQNCCKLGWSAHVQKNVSNLHYIRPAPKTVAGTRAHEAALKQNLTASVTG
jgi:hypothetical protein